jgi:hypothetical protein
MIRIRQCKKNCCTVREPSKRFWHLRSPYFTETFTSFAQAVQFADAHIQIGVPS